MAKEERRCKLLTCRERCLPQQGKMCWITFEIHRELLLLHISIMSQVLLEFLILNFVLILGRCLDIASLYADELVENYLPLTCFSEMKLEKKIHGTSWSRWYARDIPAPGVLPMGVILVPVWTCHQDCPVAISPSRKPKGKPTSGVSTASSSSSIVGCSVGPSKENLICFKGRQSHHLLGHLFFLLDKCLFSTVIHGGGQAPPTL